MRDPTPYILLFLLSLICPGCPGAQREAAPRNVPVTVTEYTEVDGESQSVVEAEWSNRYIQQVGYQVGHDGSIISIGGFRGNVDFQPGQDTEIQSSVFYSETEGDFYIVKYDSQNHLEWLYTWRNYYEIEPDSSSWIDVQAINVNTDGFIYLGGCYSGSVDLDLSEGVMICTPSSLSYSQSSAFLSKINTEGKLEWVKTWGGDYTCSVQNIFVTNSGELLAAGVFEGDMDFNPGQGTDIKSSHLEIRPTSTDQNIYTTKSTFISRFDNEGNYKNVLTWGEDTGRLRAELIYLDSNDNFYIFGEIPDNPPDGIDLQPGSGEVIISSGQRDYSNPFSPYFFFICKYDSSGRVEWDNTLAILGSARSMLASPDGSLFLLCEQKQSPTKTNQEISSTGDSTYRYAHQRWHVNYNSGTVLVKYDPQGVFQWQREWGESGVAQGSYPIGLSNEDNHVVINACLNGTVDLDPGPGVSEYAISGYNWQLYQDIFSQEGELLSINIRKDTVSDFMTWPVLLFNMEVNNVELNQLRWLPYQQYPFDY